MAAASIGMPAAGTRPTRCAAVLVWLLLAAMAVLAVPVAAQAPGGAPPSVGLDRGRIGFDESFTLIVELDGDRVGERFDIAPLRDRGDFTVLKYDNRQDVRLIGGRNRTHIVYTFELAPQRTGRLTVPPLRVGEHWTRPLTVTVLPPGDRSPPPSPPPGSEAFIEALIEERAPYVQQSVGYTLRLYYDGNSLIDGTLNQDSPQNADLFKIGEDLHYHRQLGEQTFKVLERRYSLVPARPGAVVLPAARFEGRSARSMFDDLLRGGRRQLRVFGPRYVLQARPVPAQAPQPWLPLRGVRMQWLEAPQALRAGEAATVTLRVIADGASAGQLAEPELQIAGGDAQVFPDVVRSEERFIDGRLQTTLTRSFSVVPAVEGERLSLRAPRLAWWDVAAGRARASSLPDLQLSVVAGGQVAALGVGAGAAQPEGPSPLQRRWNRLREWYAEDPGLRLAWTVLLCTWLVVMGLLVWSRLRARRRAHRTYQRQS